MTDIDHGPHLPSIRPLGPPPSDVLKLQAEQSVPPQQPEPDKPQIVVDLSRDDVPCRNCGFNLRGLTPEGRCPECGSLIWKSIQGDHLIYAGGEYLAALHRGLVIILVSVIIQLVVGLLSAIIGIGLAFAIASGTGGGTAGGTGTANLMASQNFFGAVVSLVNLPLAFLSLYGWWLFSAPDPGQREGDTGQMPRRIVRATVIALASTTVLSAIAQVMVMVAPAASIALMAVAPIAYIASIAQFFASMLYIRWIAPRIPDKSIEDRAKMYMWLLPLIYVVGACLVVGPIVATVMYLLLLNRLRIQIRGVRESAQDRPTEARLEAAD